MTAETRPDLKLPEQLTLALKLLAESEARLDLMEETLRCITGVAKGVKEARRGRRGKMAEMTERILGIRRNIASRREEEKEEKEEEEEGTKVEPQADGPTRLLRSEQLRVENIEKPAS